MSKLISSSQFPPHAVAIIGMAGRFPGARGLDEFWRNIREGVETLETFNDVDLEGADVSERADPNYVRKGTVLKECDQFDASFFGYSPREAQVIDPQQRIFLECAWEALEQAGYAGGAITQKAVGVFGGSSTNTYMHAQILRNPVISEAVGRYQLMISNDKDFLCSRVSYKLDLRGPSITIQTACSTSLVAVVLACRALSLGECDLALAGGVSLFFPRRAGYLYQEGMIFSPDGHCRPFDADGNGTRTCEGAGIVVLKRLTEALADRDTIHSVILGSAFNNDGGAKVGFTAPSIDGQAAVIASAQAQAGIEPRSITYLEANSIGTQLGDPMEIAALNKAFRVSTSDVGFCRLGSVKANLGHLDTAAGIAGLIKTTMALQHREIPPLVNFRTPNPQLELDRSPFVASAEGSVWTTTDAAPRRAGVSSFGLGGTNAHVVLEEAPQTTSESPSRGTHLLVVSAKTIAALEQTSARLADCLDAQKDLSMTDVEWTLQAGRVAFAHRRAVVVRNTAEAVVRLQRPQHAPVLTGFHDGESRPVVFLFGGQGSQNAGMGADLYEAESVYRKAIDRCATVLEPHLGLDIRKIMFAGQNDTAINETRFTQPALFATEYALASLWMSWGITPRAMLGHGIGEYVAAHLSGVFSFEDANAAVAARGRLLQALPLGGMATVHSEAGALSRFLGADVDIAAISAPGLCTVSGPTNAITDLLKRLETSGIEARQLQTSHAFHSAMMDPAILSFTAVLERMKLSPPKIPYVSNVTGKLITPEQATSPAYYGVHMRKPVLFETGTRTLAADPAALFLEVGPGDALASLVRLTLGKERTKYVISSLPHLRDNKPNSESMLEAAGQLWLAGAKLDWSGFHAGSQPRRIPLPTYPFERKRHWVEAVGMHGAVVDRSDISVIAQATALADTAKDSDREEFEF
jgi:phthiocerol/phenolphthiocerol synthesis type-I polyketide synthase E